MRRRSAAALGATSAPGGVIGVAAAGVAAVSVAAVGVAAVRDVASP
ncbi:hypothetical protein AB3M83_12585 [Microbacterium sp. 179-B 1A2 NHS]